MAHDHFDALPTIALQLAVEVDRYRCAIRALAADPRDDEARTAASDGLRVAGVLAFAVPAIWTSWGDMVVRHSAFTSAWLQSSGQDDLMRAWRHLEDRAEIVTQRCVDWALRRNWHRPVAEPAARRFLAWDDARREAFGLSRQIDAFHEMSGRGRIEEAIPQALYDRHDMAWIESGRLLADALAALYAPQDANAPATGPTDGLHAFESMHEHWRLADDAAAAAELAIFEMDLQGLPVTGAQRERAAELRAQAHACRQSILDAGRL